MLYQGSSTVDTDKCIPADQPDQMSFQLSDYLVFEEGPEDSTSSAIGSSQIPLLSTDSGENSGEYPPGNTSREYENPSKKTRVEVGCRVAFRTKSELEVMDDGFKWRKYGKKSVKNSPNPRNYYRCANGGCSVKKRVERDRDDSSFVITTYDGVHNHQSPCVIYYTPQQVFDVGSSRQIPIVAPSTWVLQAAHLSS